MVFSGSNRCPKGGAYPQAAPPLSYYIISRGKTINESPLTQFISFITCSMVYRALPTTCTLIFPKQMLTMDSSGLKDFEFDGHQCIVMPFIDGGTLQSEIPNGHCLSERWARYFFQQLICAVLYLAQQVIFYVLETPCLGAIS